MTTNQIEIALENITVGKTTTIAGSAVTRWSKNTYEVGTWGKKTQTIDEAVAEVLK